MLRLLILGLPPFGFLIGLTASLAQDHPAKDLPVPQSSLSIEERARAISLAAPQPSALSPLTLAPNAVRPASAPNRVVVSNVQPVDDKTDRRLALVTLYQYEGNVTINRVVDLNAAKVISERQATDIQPPLAPVERELARALVLADERVTKQLEERGLRDAVRLEFLLTSNPDPSSPLHGRRVVGVLFKSPRGYLTGGPQVYADLTEGRVILE